MYSMIWELRGRPIIYHLKSRQEVDVVLCYGLSMEAQGWSKICNINFIGLLG